jgi:hypothetical protein
MKILFWVVLVAFVLLAGYVAIGLVQHPRTKTVLPTVPYEVSAESVAVYEQRAAELEKRAVELSRRMAAIGSLERADVKARLAEFELQIRELKRAIAQWQIARGGDAPDAAYRQCIFLYGKAQGTCASLASDTLTGK